MAKNEEPKDAVEAEAVTNNKATKKQNKGVTLSSTQLLLILIIAVSIGLAAGIIHVNNKVDDLQDQRGMMRIQKLDNYQDGMRQRRPMQNQYGN